MSSLIERLESAEGPSRELDQEILLALHPTAEWKPYKKGARVKWLRDNETGSIVLYKRDHCPRFTSSLDAALTLVPEGWHIERLSTSDPDLRSRNPDRAAGCVLCPNMTNDDGWVRGRATSNHREAAIALTIASLRARGIG